MLDTHEQDDGREARRRAVCAALGAAPGLVRYAARFTQSLEDAEDAYQRAMEIALTKAPLTDHDSFMAWLRTVIRRCAREIAETRAVETPLAEADLDLTINHASNRHVPSPQSIVEWRERYHVVQEALTGLSDPQRVCLMLMSTGVTLEEIGSATGFSARKVERCIAEGRSRLRAWEVRVSNGIECERIAPLIERVTENQASRSERSALSRHVRHCGHCRVAYHGRREQLRVMAALVPGALTAPDLMQVHPPDPSFALSWWERMTGSATVRAGQTMQVMFDLPSLAASKAGAGAIAAVAAGTISAPLVLDAVRTPPAPEPTVAVRTAPTAATPASPTASPKGTLPKRRTFTAPKKPKVTATVVKRTKARITPRRTSVVVRSATRSATYRRPTPQPKARATPRASAPALEFGP